MHAEGQFRGWLRDELRRRGWSQAELARRSGVNSVNISNYLHKEPLRRNVPGEEICDRIADALGLERDVVRSVAGRPLTSGATIHATDTSTDSIEGCAKVFIAALARLNSPEQRVVATRIAVDTCNRLAEMTTA